MKALEVLAYLALRRARGAEREEVIEAVWPEREPDKGRMLLRAALSEIRRRLEPERQTGETSQFLLTVGGRVQIVARVDVDEVARIAWDGEASQALALFRGELLDDMPYSEWAFDERRTFSTLRAELADRTSRDQQADLSVRLSALELLIAEQPWQAKHYDNLASLQRQAGNETAARSVERRKLEAGAT